MSGSTDRAQRSMVVYDARGQAEASVRQMAVMPRARGLRATLRPDLGGPDIQAVRTPRLRRFDEDHDYIARTRYDYLGRAVAMDYPEDPDWFAMGGTGPAPTVGGALHYNTQGLPAGVTLRVAEEGTGAPLYEVPVVRSIQYDANRLPRRLDYGDESVIGPLFTEMTYDERQRPTRSRAVRRGDPTAPGDRPLNAVNTIHDFRYTWDAVSNLMEVADARVAAEWPAGYRPWRQTVSHDALYRVNRIDFAYMNDGGEFGDEGDAATDWRGERTRPNNDGSTHEQRDPMHQRPAPMISQNGTSRVNQLLYDYDWLANQTDWIDDQGVFYERAAGLLVSGNDEIGFDGENPETRPSALYLSTNIREAPAAALPGDLGGYVTLTYGNDGNVVQMTVHGQCQDRNPNTNNPDRTCADPVGSSIAARQARLDARCLCQVEQHYRYDWDELNRLSEARRYDREGGAGRWALMTQQRYRYDAGNVRMIKETIDPGGVDRDAFAATALSPYPGDYERRGLELDFQGRTYHASTALGTETQYMVGGARLVWATHERGGAALDREQRLTLPLSDLVQSTAAAVDLQSGDLIEHTTFYPNGARETHLSTDEVSMQLEPVGFTGKEADEEVGLVYFGERYLIPRLGRWASVDPLSVHQMGGGEAMNGYHYVNGNLLQARDPVGLQTRREVRNTPGVDFRAAVEALSGALGPNAPGMGPLRYALSNTTFRYLNGRPAWSAEYQQATNTIRIRNGAANDLITALWSPEWMRNGGAQTLAEMVEESTHSMVRRGDSVSPRIADLHARVMNHYEGIEPRADSGSAQIGSRLSRPVDLAFFADEAISGYAGIRAGAYATARVQLAETLAGVQSGRITPETAREQIAQARLEWTSSNYQALRYGYDWEGDSAYRGSKPLSNDLANEIDDEFLGGMSRDFDTAMAPELQAIEGAQQGTTVQAGATQK